MGGHKGAGLDFMIGVLAGVLNGAAFGQEVVADSREPGRASNAGQALLVLRPDVFLARDEFVAEMDRQLATFRASKSASDQPVRLPGERAAATEEQRRRDGIPVPDPLLAELRVLADELELADRLD
jgi:LDH2 family malate/lactate/ureidoglycolate dehydrogenase